LTKRKIFFSLTSISKW